MLYITRAAAILVCASAACFAQITSWSLAFGGVDAVTCSGYAPGTTALSAGSMGFTYDASTARLTLVVTNTSPTQPGFTTPLIGNVRFNVPTEAVTGMTLVSQTAAAGGPANFGFTFDPDVRTNPNPNATKLNCFGSFNAALTSAHPVNGTLMNASATSFSGSGHCLGSVTFEFDVTGPGTQWVTAGAFAQSLSSGNGSGAFKVQAAFKTQGMTDGSVSLSEEIGAAGGCAPVAYATGQNWPGGHMDLYVSGGPGCGGCLVFSFNPPPTIIGGVSWDVGYPFFELLEVVTNGITHGGELFSLPVDLPPIAGLVGLDLYFSTILYSPSTGGIYVSQNFRVTLIAPPL